MQHLLARARSDADGVRYDLRGFVVEQLSDPHAVLVVEQDQSEWQIEWQTVLVQAVLTHPENAPRTAG
jgi:hypothetical protein